jgi:arsenate reductase
MIRTNEEIWKTKYKGNIVTDEELLLALELHPILIERPLVYSEKFALVARPPQKILDFLYSF